MIKKTINDAKILMYSMIDAIDQKYESLFKGAVVLIGVSLAGLIQTYPEITKFDFEARKLQYQVEERVGKEIDDIDCSVINEKKSVCNLAKYQLNANSSAMKLASLTIVLCGYFGIFLLCLSVQGFVVRALRINEKRT